MQPKENQNKPASNLKTIVKMFHCTTFTQSPSSLISAPLPLVICEAGGLGPGIWRSLIFSNVVLVLISMGLKQALQLKCVDLNPNSKEICANFLLTLFVANNACSSLGWPFTKETIRNNISCLPRARVSLSLIVCTECNQHFGCLAFILEKTHCCFLLSRVKVEVVVCTYCNQHRVVLAFISETILCFLSSRTKAQFVVCTHCNQHQDRLAECQSSISSP